MPKFKDTLTGKILEFDHEPTQQELNAASSTGNITPPQREDASSALAPGLGGTIGALIGGKTPLGKLGAGIGAAAGTGFGDLYNMFSGGEIPTPGDEAKRLATVGGVTSGLEMAVPPVLRAVGSLKSVMPRGSATLGGGALGWLLGHPQAGAAAGIGIEAAPKVAVGIDWLGTPYKPSSPEPPPQAVMSDGRPRIRDPRAAPMPTPAPQADTGPSLLDRLKSMGSSALDGLSNLTGKFGVEPPPAPPSPANPFTPRSTEIPYRISEDMLPDASHVKAPSGGDEGMVYPNMTREPNLKYGADVSAVPQRPVKGPNLTQTSPTDPQMPWEDYTNTTSPRRSSAKSFDSVEVSSPLDALRQAAPAVEPAPAIGTHDTGLQRWLEGGGTPEGYAAARGRLQPPSIGGDHAYGPNTVGAAQKPTYLPKTVDEAKGLSLAEQEAWEGFKRANPGTSDSMLNSWYTSHQLGADPNEGLDLTGKIDKLLSLLKPK